MSEFGRLVGDLLVLGLVGFAIAAVVSVIRMTRPPPMPSFAKPRSTSASGQLRPDLNAQFVHDRFGFLFRRRHFFVGTGCPPKRFSAAKLDQHEADQNHQPTALASFGPRTWWWFENAFYWESGNYTRADVLALIRDRQRRERNKLDRAHTLLRADQAQLLNGSGRRGPISRELRRAVYERDGGRCTQCGATFDLQYDHVLPVALGGATSLENLQLLCGTCNRAKSANL